MLFCQQTTSPVAGRRDHWRRTYDSAPQAGGFRLRPFRNLKEYQQRRQTHRSETRRQEARAQRSVCEADDDQPGAGCCRRRDPIPRTEVTKRLWDHIKAHKLQDAQKRTLINADDKLFAVFDKRQVTMFEMTKLVNAHLS